MNKPVRIEFEIPYFTISGLNVKYMKITDQSGYDASPWVRYITQAMDYEVRIY
jgi:AP-1 complex subunit mu